MGIVLYKAGSTHTVRGVRCDMQVFNEASFTHNIGNGWFLSPEECYAKPEEEGDGVLVLDEMGDDEIRMLARERDIKNWYNKGIDKLKSELDTWQPET